VGQINGRRHILPTLTVPLHIRTIADILVRNAVIRPQ